MNDHSPNDQFHASSFMQGHNAEYLEQMYAQYANDPNAVDAAWQEFFRAMGDDEVSVKREAQGPVGHGQIGHSNPMMIGPLPLQENGHLPLSKHSQQGKRSKKKPQKKVLRSLTRRSNAPFWTVSVP